MEDFSSSLLIEFIIKDPSKAVSEKWIILN